MRLINKIGSGILMLCLFTSCKKDKLLTYSTDDNIYFKYTPKNNFTDTVDLSFGYSPLSVTDSVFGIPVFVTGSASDRDRTYSVSVVSDVTTAVEGVHYVLPPVPTFRAGRISDTLKVKLLRSADLQQKPVSLTLELKPGNDLKTNVTSFATNVAGELNILRFRINVSDNVGPGSYWTGIFAAFFGTFSVKKVRLINEIAGMPLDYYTTGWLTDLNLNARAGSWAIFMSRYLSDQKKAGNTIYDEDGSEMTMGVAYR